MVMMFQQITSRLIQHSEVVGPVVLSALSVFLTFCFLQPIVLSLDPSFSLLANRSVGKIAFTVVVLLHIALLLTTTSKKFLLQCMHTNLFFLRNTAWVDSFLIYFTLFFCLHSLLLFILSIFSYAYINLHALTLIPAKIGSLAWGFIATFFLAWTEETIFRGTLFPFLNQKLSIPISIILTSLIFTLAHNLTNPLLLFTVTWKLGIGLFLLGTFLNIVFVKSNKLYIGMGIHAGLVFVKVFLRRIPLVGFPAILPWWIDVDLRQSFVVHVLFLCVILYMLKDSAKSPQ